jgi:polyprenyl-phospho-N-acetylgalactosaminyl synthase
MTGDAMSTIQDWTSSDTQFIIARHHEESFRSKAEVLPDNTWIVIAAYNEAARIGLVLDGLTRLTNNIVVVDDGSVDATSREILFRPVWLVRHSVNLGQGAALQTGISFAMSRGAQYVVTFDADGQHDPEDIPVLLSALRSEAAEFALGSRFLGRASGMPLSRKVILKLAILFTKVLSGVSLSDAHNGIRAMTRQGMESIRITLNRMEHASEIIDQIAASGLKYIEVPVRIKYTEASLAKGQRSSAAIRLGLKLLLERAAI